MALPFPRRIGQLMAETTYEVIGWASTLSRTELAECLTAGTRNGSVTLGRTAFENTPRSSRKLAPLFTPGSEAYAEGSQASTCTRASHLTTDEERD